MKLIKKMCSIMKGSKGKENTSNMISTKKIKAQ